MSTARPVPEINDANRPFWEGVNNGELRFQRCSDCQHLRYPINAICPRCLSPEFSWHTVTGDGEILSYIIVHQVYNQAFADVVPYNVALIQLQEGPRMFSNIVEPDGVHAKVGDRVQVTFSPITATFTLPQFTVVGS